MTTVLIGLVAILALAVWLLKAKGYTGISKILTVLIVIIVAGYLIYVAMTPPDIVINDGNFKVLGPYGITKPLSSIKSVELKESIPKILNKTNGIDLFGFVFRGNFKVDGLGVVKLYLQRNVGPYVFIKYDEKYIILNNNNSNNTEEIYLKLLTAMKK